VSSGAFRRLETVHGYPLDEAVSALQKCVRRSMVDEALWWAMEMNKSGFAAYCYRRLMVIANEDIGIADHFAPVLVNACYQMGKELQSRAPGTAAEKADREWTRRRCSTPSGISRRLRSRASSTTRCQ